MRISRLPRTARQHRDDGRRTHHINIANWIPDLFCKRVEQNGSWSLFDPKDVPELPDLFGEVFENAYQQAEGQGLAKKTLPARDLYARMMRCWHRPATAG